MTALDDDGEDFDGFVIVCAGASVVTLFLSVVLTAACETVVEAASDLISGEGSSARMSETLLLRCDLDACERDDALRGVEMADCGDASVAGDDNVALSTTVTSSRAVVLVVIDALSAAAVARTRDGVDLAPDVASKPRLPA